MHVYLFSFLFSVIQCSKILTTSYGKVEGNTISSADGNHKYSFKSIPFAKPPVGNLRYALLQNPDPWDGVLNATTYSAVCLANNTHSQATLKNMNEDCIYINFFTSENCLKKSCPVIHFFHGGAYNRYSASVIPDDFIFERYVSLDVVFVSPAFRLGSFGQLYFGPENGLVQENLLISDAVHGLHFMHNEIKNFGGNPNEVTIFGHSTGAFMVNIIGFSDLIDPEKKLFQQMIALSAPGEFGFNDIEIDGSFLLAERCGCETNNRDDSASNVQQILDCLRKIDANVLLGVQSEIMTEDTKLFRNILIGAPMMKKDEKIATLKKNTSPRNLLYGTTEFELSKTQKDLTPHAAGRFLDLDNTYAVVDYYYEQKKNHSDWIEMDTADIFVSARTYCEAMVEAGGTVYLYETRQKPSSEHISDMQYFMGIRKPPNRTPEMDVLDSFYSKMLVNFVKTGKPSEKWEKLDLKRMNYIELKIDLETGEGPVKLEHYHDKEMEVWFGDMMSYDRNLTEMRNMLEYSNQISIFRQPWIYLIIFIVLLVVLFIVICCVRRRKMRQEEAQPLLR